MKHDSEVALGLAVVSLLLLVKSIRLPVLDVVSNPIAVLLLVGIISTAVMQGYILVALVSLVVGLYLARESLQLTPREHRIYVDGTADQTRFSSNSVDIQIANRTLQYDSPTMLDTSQPAEPLLMYPPSDETLRSLSGV